MERIGIIGLGRMGGALAARFAAQGRSVTGWTRSGLTEARAQALGISHAADVADLVRESDVIVMSLLDDAAVAGLLDQLLACDLSGRLIVETSTVVPTLLTERIDRIHALGAQAVDAPIAGGPELVANGTCGLFIGGEATAAARAQAVLSVVSDKVFHVGPLGTGLVMKTINNAMLQTYVLGMKELLPLAKRAGLPLETVLRILSAGPAGVPMIRDRIPKILGADPEVGFPLTGILKDNEVFQRVAQAFDVPAPLLQASGAAQADAIARGLGEKDPAALIADAYDRG